MTALCRVVYDFYRRALDPHNFLTYILSEYIILLNSVDLLISKLSTDNIKIHLNLTGIVIEEERDVFNFAKLMAGNDHYIDVDQVVNHFAAYGIEHHQTITQDSFDFYLILTRKNLWSFNANDRADGFSWRNEIFETRTNPRYKRFWQGAVVDLICGYEYPVIAHELAHLLKIDHDALNKGYCSPQSQCYGLMRTRNGYCQDCN